MIKKVLKNLYKFLINFFIDIGLSYLGALLGTALYVTFTDTTLEGTIALQFIITLVTLQVFRFVQYARSKL